MEKNLKKNRSIYTYNNHFAVHLEHNTANQLYFKNKFNKRNHR